MNWMDKLERKLGRYAVPNLSRYFVGAIVLGYVLSMLSPGFTDWISYDVSAILHGQIWRLFTWIFMPTTSLDFFGLLFLLCVLMWGSSLESMLGTFRMNVFLWGGYLCDHKVNTWNRCFNLSVHLLHSDVDASCFGHLYAGG